MSDQAWVGLGVFVAGVCYSLGRGRVHEGQKRSALDAVTDHRLGTVERRVDAHEAAISDHSADISEIKGTLSAIHEAVDWIKAKLGGKE